MADCIAGEFACYERLLWFKLNARGLIEQFFLRLSEYGAMGPFRELLAAMRGVRSVIAPGRQSRARV
jgi:hypothetical protein